MPFVTDTKTGPFQQLPEPVKAPDVPTPPTADIFGAAFRQENSIVSMAEGGLSFGSDFQTEEGFDPFEGDKIKGYELFADSFVFVTRHSLAS